MSDVVNGLTVSAFATTSPLLDFVRRNNACATPRPFDATLDCFVFIARDGILASRSACAP